jgi:hypothetical protein
MSSKTFRMEERDYDILKDIAQCGGLTAEQINYLHFAPVVMKGRLGIHSNCQRRLKLLREAKFLSRIDRYQLLKEGKKPYLYALSSHGAECLSEHLGCAIVDLQWRKRDTRLRPNYIEHLIMTNNIRSAVMKAVRRSAGLVLLEWRDELTLAKLHNAFKIPLRRADRSTEMVSLIPDAYFVLQTPTGELKHFFLEVDRGTEKAAGNHESDRTYKRKIETYLEFLEGTLYQEKEVQGKKMRSLYEERYGTHTGRVLTVTTGMKRLDRLKKVSEDAGARQRFWFTLHKTVMLPNIEDFNLSEDAPKREKKATAHFPNILSDKLWSFACNDTGELHSLDEHFQRQP